MTTELNSERAQETPDEFPSPRARAKRLSTALLAVVITLVAIVLLWTRRERATAGSIPSGGKSGMSGMPLGGNSSVTLTSDQIRQFGIAFATVVVRPLVAETRATGTVTFDETRVAQVVPKFGGYVERLYVNSTGQPVRFGQPLLDVYSPDLVTAQQELLSAAGLQRDIGRTSVPGVPGTSGDLVESAKRRLRLWDISDAQIEDVLRSGRARRTLTLYAPVTGVVTEKRVQQGQAIQPGEQLYTIADLSNVWVDVQLREADATAVRMGSGADIEVAGLPGRPFKGRVTYIYPTLDSTSRAIRARVAVANTNGLLKPGMYATVRLSTPSRSALTVPNSAVLRTGERNVVFVDNGGGRLMPQEVELGRVTAEYSEVLAGLKPGQRVVTSAQFLLDSESNLAEVMKSMMGQMSAADMSRMADTPGIQIPQMNDKGANTRGMSGMPPAKAPSPATPRR
jgi:Cu(I)/Ag(I) efflux system membrane fusion protein